MWFAIIGVAALVASGLVMRRTINIVEAFERDRAQASEHEVRLRNLETFKRQMEHSGEHAIADLSGPPNVHPRIVHYEEESAR